MFRDWRQRPENGDAMYQIDRLNRSIETLKQLRGALAASREGMERHAQQLDTFERTSREKGAIAMAALADILRREAIEGTAAFVEMDTALALVVAELETVGHEVA